jgi:predicted outer membrane lipoprotein
MVIKKSSKKFGIEFRKLLGTAVIAAFGLLTALAWKDVITGYMENIISLSPVQGKLISALIVTAISVIVIILITKLIPSE